MSIPPIDHTLYPKTAASEDDSWALYLEALTCVPLTPIEEETSETPAINAPDKRKASPAFAPKAIKMPKTDKSSDDSVQPPKKWIPWTKYELKQIKTAASAKKAVMNLGTAKRSKQAIQCKWRKIYPMGRIQNPWLDKEITILKTAPSSREAIKLLGTQNHSKYSIQHKWAKVGPQEKKMIQKPWLDDEVKRIETASSAKEAAMRLGTQNRSEAAIRMKWRKIRMAHKVGKEG